MSKGFVPMVRVKTLDFAGTEYEGLEVKVRTNYPLGLEEEIQSGDSERLRGAMAQIVREWNLCDENGEPLGPPSAENMRRVTTDILGVILERAMEAAKEGLTTPNAGRRSDNS